MTQAAREIIPPHHATVAGVTYMWGGLATCLCTSCFRLFTSGDSFDRHYIMDQSTGEMICYDPAEILRKDGGHAFEKIDKPTWNPPEAWSRLSPSRGEHPMMAR